MAGGQSLIPLLKLRVATVDVIVDLNGVPGLDGIEEADGELRIGALVRHADAKVVAPPGALPRAGQHRAARRDPLVRNRGTVCGSLAHADPRATGPRNARCARQRRRAAPAESGRSRSTTSRSGPFSTTLARTR